MNSRWNGISREPASWTNPPYLDRGGDAAAWRAVLDLETGCSDTLFRAVVRHTRETEVTQLRDSAETCRDFEPAAVDFPVPHADADDRLAYRISALLASTQAKWWFAGVLRNFP